MKRAALVLAAVVVLAVWPLLTDDTFLQRIGALVMLGAISASAWNLIGGYAGQVSVGHAVYFGAGAYASLLVFTRFGWPPVAGAPLGVAVSLALAALIGTPTFRLRGHYFSMATIAAAELIRILVGNWDLLGAAVGLMGPAVPRSLADLSFTAPLAYYYIFGAVLALVLAITWWLQHGRLGFYLRAINGGDRAARSLGVPVLRYKLYALLLSAGFTSIAGTLYAVMVGFADPDSTPGHPDLGEDGDHGGPGGRRHLAGPDHRGGDSGAAGGIAERAVRRLRHRHYLRGLRRHHPARRAVRAGRAGADGSPHLGKAGDPAVDPPCLRQPTSSRRSAPSAPWTAPACRSPQERSSA